MSISLEIIAVAKGFVSHINKDQNGVVGQGNQFVCPVVIQDEEGGEMDLLYMCYRKGCRFELGDQIIINVVSVDDKFFVKGFARLDEKQQEAAKVTNSDEKKQTKAKAAKAAKAKAARTARAAKAKAAKAAKAKAADNKRAQPVPAT